MLQTQRSEPAQLETKSCKECNTPYLMTRPNKRYCSTKCGRKANHRKQRQGINKECTCKGCGVVFNPKGYDRTECCSRECGWKWRSAKARRLRILSWITKPEPNNARQCILCDKVFISKSKSSICSDECRKIISRTKVSERAKHIHNMSVDARECKECSAVFTPIYGYSGVTYCSRTCSFRHNKRISKQKRRAIKRACDADNIDAFKVFNEADWKCQSCGIDTPRQLRGKHKPNSPELDHIFPLSKGGSHTYDNVQLLCRGCNSVKSDTVQP